MANRPEQYTAHAAKNPVCFIGKQLEVHLGAGGKKKKNGAGNWLLVKTTLQWIADQKNTLLYRDVEGNPSLHFMVDILQQKGERENKIKPQINLQATG